MALYGGEVVTSGSEGKIMLMKRVHEMAVEEFNMRKRMMKMEQ